MSVYLGYDVLELNYNRNQSLQERIDRKVARLDSRTGEKWFDEQSPAPNPTRPFVWTANGKAEMAVLRAFLDARHGRAVPFWFPSFQWDLSLAEDLASTVSIATIVWARYTEQMFGTTGGRRYVALWTYGIPTPLDPYKIADANDPGNGSTESITLSPAATRLYPKATTVISFLKLCRLESDEVEIAYPGGDVAEARIAVRELPLEAVP